MRQKKPRLGAEASKRTFTDNNRFQKNIKMSAVLILEMPKSKGKSDCLMESIGIADSYFIAERSEM